MRTAYGGRTPTRLLLGLVLAVALLVVATGGHAATTYELVSSTSSDRATPVALHGATVTGAIFVFTTPSTGVSRVRFYLDNPSMSGSPRKVENGAPHDFAGTASNGAANPFDTTTVANGQHTITAAIDLAAGGTQVLNATFTVANGGPPPPPPPSGYELVRSASPDRSQPTPLAGSVVSGDTHVFTTPGSGVSQVRFYLDNPTMSGSPRKVEKGAPHDFAGTAANGGANPFDTTTIAEGQHTITAAIDLTSGGTNVLSSSFTVANSGPALRFVPTSIGFASAPGSGPAPQSVALETSDGAPASYSTSDDATWLDVAPAVGSTPSALTLSVNAQGLGAGTHSATVSAVASGYASASLAVTLDIQGSEPPDQVHLAWVEDSATTMTVIWHTRSASTPSRLEYRPVGAGEWQAATAAPRPSGTSGTLHEGTLRSLTPSTAYEYRVGGDGGAWSPVFTTRTAPAGPADFDAVYVADTGIVGRTDGLATGTQQVIDEIRALDPDLVLLGGDYAYYNTDKRFGSLNNTIDAWFNQMQPIGARAPMMVTYGNHEALLEETVADWAPRFATPTGHDGRRNYSFDVGDVHFVSVFAVTETNGLPSGTLTWIEQDIEAARARGQRWIVPFFHVSPFSDGTSHPSNLGLRSSLGPLFERLGVKLAISSHDQSYERTYPLTGVPATNTPTSTAKRCYTMDDGVTWVKVSPGGKLSSKNGNFSQFTTNPQPAWTAVRENSMHHFARLVVSAAGSMRLDTYGVVGDGSPPVLVDSFEYTTGECTGELAFATQEAVLHARAGGPGVTQTLSLTSSATAPATFTLTEDAPWLTVSPTSGSTPTSLTLSATPSGLLPGTYSTTLRASAPGNADAIVRVTLGVHGLLFSSAPDRSAPAALDGRTVSKRIYVFTAPEAGVTRVRFWLDNPSMSGTPRKTEGNAPFDFAGSVTTTGLANPFDTTTIANGAHSITAAADLASGGTFVVTTPFTVANP